MMNRRTFLGSSAALLAAACAPRGAGLVGEPMSPASADAAAARLIERAIVLDGNLVPPIDDEKPLPADVVQAVRASRLTALKLSLGGSHSTYQETQAELAAVTRGIATSGGLYHQVRTLADLDAGKRTGSIGIIYSFESVDMLEGQVARIAEFAAQGVRVMQLSYNRSSPFAAGVLAPQPSSGLTALGREAVARMNELGVTVDISHSDEASCLAVIAASRKPVVVSHAGCTAVYGHPRNKPDRVLRALADRGGTFGIYELSFLSRGPAQQSLDDYLAHLRHALDVCGEDHVAIGSDAPLMPFDTSPESMVEWDKGIAERRTAGVAAPEEGRPPYVEGLNRSDRMVRIASALLARGVRERVVDKILGANLRRVIAATWT